MHVRVSVSAWVSVHMGLLSERVCRGEQGVGLFLQVSCL